MACSKFRLTMSMSMDNSPSLAKVDLIYFRTPVDKENLRFYKTVLERQLEHMNKKLTTLQHCEILRSKIVKQREFL